MSLVRKQHADLVRHRELNALRRLMYERKKTVLRFENQLSAAQVKALSASEAIYQIDRLEAQMSEQLRESYAHHLATDETAFDFEHTHIQAFHATEELIKSPPIKSPEFTVVQEASEHFAQDRAHMAQSLLEQAVGEGGKQQNSIPTWLAFFDLYRATDQLGLFEALALDYSIRFGRSPPQWVSIVQQATLAGYERDPVPTNQAMDWTAAQALTKDDLVELEQVVGVAAKGSRHITINWAACAPSNPVQWRLLQVALDYLASQQVYCAVRGITELTQTFDLTVKESVLAKLALARCQNLAQLYEDLAIDYSLQFEISPPDWVPPVCRFELDSGASHRMQLVAQGALPAELFGSLDGESAARMLATITPAQGLVIRCDRLVRCDQVAVGVIKRFAQAAKAQAMEIEFQGVHRMVAAYFMKNDLYTYARVTLRRD